LALGHRLDLVDGVEVAIPIDFREILDLPGIPGPEEVRGFSLGAGRVHQVHEGVPADQYTADIHRIGLGHAGAGREKKAEDEQEKRLHSYWVREGAPEHGMANRPHQYPAPLVRGRYRAREDA